ncbi:carbohydrate ABC transporter permease [Ructibacterium gallinarum]|uniref:Carbohydrate ABC transporter permease n=1 Tax=Ructibacterium gallinarum TaxID=2779355 RepID=A0A9D5M5Y2_9FIRM|nr:carbohydrate ABC transporter permease [Ructibacterium gallinarum]MBE5040082.1 carbohydrate ABC transporter permease [Ructibacterium gallinarum]
MKQKYTSKKKSLFFNITVNILFIVICFCCIVPLLLVFSISITPEKLIAQNGYQLIPQQISFYAYTYIFKNSFSIWHSYGVTIFVTAVGTLIGLSLTSLIAYPLSRKDVKYRNYISMYLFFTMLFNGGLVPTYILITKYLHLKNNIWVLILPMLVGPWNVMLMRNFFKTGVPSAIIESAKIDGAGEFQTFLKIVVPISKPAFATVGLFVILAYWNDWWLALLYIDEQSLMPLQYTLQSILLNIQILMSNINSQTHQVTEIPSESARMALCMLAVGPIVLVYPFLQKYIVKGMTVGAVKG